ncbi:MAG: bifunctional phosphopantothenoylcysteine decarboxylase/phosphopantothenate--cysteine ligase CoaBC [Candidatus Omnitrophica bacterium]|nr:bifunctional phosphopantothenoylcysteine decarboxylase/phosphopantothenate--cysteine ligase CoaBC [Candidatus Omnitrophota bacterium]
MSIKNKNILIGVTGGIAAYKICDLINLMRKEGAKVKVVMTPAAQNFITPLTIQTLTNNPVYLDMFNTISKVEIEHISLATWADVILIAPATANTISKIAMGLADNLLTTVVMAATQNTPVVIAPAMNTNMWKNPFIQENVKKIKQSKKYIFVEPKVGRLACGDIGEGPLAEIADILSTVKKHA